jgi:hypothetical protein
MKRGDIMMGEANNLGKAIGAPGIPKIIHDNYDKDGNYTLTMNMWWGNNGSQWKLYENGQLILTQDLVDNSPNAQTASASFTGKEEGTYVYRCELINSFGITPSADITVNVGTSNDGSGIRISGVDAPGKSMYQFTIDQTSQDYTLSVNGPTTPNFSISTNNSSVISYQLINGATLRLKGLKAGRASLKISDTASDRTRFVGVRVKSAGGKIPGMPEYLSIGSVSEDVAGDLNFWRDFQSDLANKRMDIRYIYLNGGPVKGWRTWTDKDGGRAESFINESLKLGMIPFFVYYNIPDSGESYEIDKQHIEDETYMQGYYKDLKFALDIINKTAKDETVGIVLEPDFLGYMMQNSGKRPGNIFAKTSAVYSSGVLNASTDPVFPNTLEGLVKAINYTISKYAPNVYFGWQFNLWASTGITVPIPASGIMHLTDTMGMVKGRAAIAAEAKEIAKYYIEAGITSYGAKFVSIDKYGYDAGSTSPANPAQSKWFWNADHWNNYLLFSKTLHQEAKLPVVLWQLPVGHINSSLATNPYDKSGVFPDLANTSANYEDSAPVFFLGDTFKVDGVRLDYFSTNQGQDPRITVLGNQVKWEPHMKETAEAGIVSILFGAGINDSTDGVGSPPTDKYWWITQVQKYFKSLMS